MKLILSLHEKEDLKDDALKGEKEFVVTSSSYQLCTALSFEDIHLFFPCTNDMTNLLIPHLSQVG